jgi:lysophospholipase L1-like esterase
LIIGGIAVLAGCGGGDAPEPAGDAAAGGPPPRLVATLGDSITAGSPGYDPDPRMRETLGFGADEKSQWQHWAEKADPRLHFRNCGVYGQRTDQIARRLDDCARDAQVLIVQGGINDIAQGRPVDRAADNLQRMLERGKQLVGRVELAELLPWNNGYPQADPKIRRLNTLIHEIAREEDVPVLPFYSTLEDPDRLGRMREQWTSDGDHPSVEGYRLLGERAFRWP